jgi:hypothetical protein
VIAQREALDHPLEQRIHAAPALAQAQPQRLFDSRHGRRARHAATAGGCQVVATSRGLHVIDPERFAMRTSLIPVTQAEIGSVRDWRSSVLDLRMSVLH